MPVTNIKNAMAPGASGKRLRLLINGVIVAALVYLSVVTGAEWLGMMETDNRQTTLISEQTPQAPDKEAPDTGKHLAALHLFGKADDAASETAIPAIAPETRLDLTLRGIFSGNKVDHGFAIIQNNRDRKERYFTVRQKVFDLAILVEIYDDRVILEHNGRYETLRLPKQSLSREHFYDSAEIQAEKKRVATNYRDRFLSRDGMDLIKLFGFEEAYINGGFAGFKVKALGEEGREMMATLGVEDGDLVTVLNGKRFSEGLEAFEEIKKLKTATSVDIIIDRNGNEIPFHFEFEAPPENTDTTGLVSAPEQTGAEDMTAPAADLLQDSGDPARNQDNPGVSVNDNPGSGAGSSPGSSGASTVSEDEDLGVDWDETPEAEAFRARQRERTTGSTQPIEYDH